LSTSPLPQEFLDFLKTIRGKRSRIVIEHILEHGFITTEDLEGRYGYKHAPRAVRDVREQGVPIDTFQVKNSEGKTIAAYRFGDVRTIQHGQVGGRKSFPKALKLNLLEQQNSRCAICFEMFDERFL
jgi:hypothetical protein